MKKDRQHPYQFQNVVGYCIKLHRKLFNLTNFHNAHEIPHAERSQNFLKEFSVIVWMGTFGEYVLDSLPARLNGPLFLNFLETNYNEMLENVTLQRRRGAYFQLDGDLDHFALIYSKNLARFALPTTMDWKKWSCYQASQTNRFNVFRHFSLKVF